MSQNLRTQHLYGTHPTYVVAQTGAGTVNSAIFFAPRDKTATVIAKVTKTGGTLAGTAKIQCSNNTDDEIARGTADDDWVDEGSLASQAIGDATVSLTFKITRAIFKRYRLNIVFSGGNSTIQGRLAV